MKSFYVEYEITAHYPDHSAILDFDIRFLKSIAANTERNLRDAFEANLERVEDEIELELPCMGYHIGDRFYGVNSVEVNCYIAELDILSGKYGVIDDLGCIKIGEQNDGTK